MAQLSVVSQAVIQYVGKGRSAAPTGAWPSEGSSFDAETRSRAEAIVGFLDRVHVDWGVEDWASADAEVRSSLHRQFPELNDDAVSALVWKFDYDWK